ncbi:PTS system mannose/fructose/sorbose family transporter subunit IID [Sporolactobacillus laevolacticus]|uniref:PTS system mannose/fructose/sorbose family transporter subunit IID n=1 Tax=Sporolactobacillus laevolacticus TaxID=33018 RepID=UPI0025B28297|nr:PTS system mannose/fructose/sorbose family transporter subunit IID [Sporolactobacillus laevolacticus]MDN3955606.1 PTS system mannose/fructose/sorbose family transporter subunit IID [Sporolactobacillus laevolacticus]
MSDVQTNNNVESNQILTKKDIRKAAFRYMFMACNVFNYETQQGPGVVYALSPALRKIHKNNDKDYIESLNNHFNYFNTTTPMANILLGASLAMEEKDGIQAKDAVQSLKTSLMGPLAGIGDTIIWVLWPTIMGSISGYMALEGNPLGAIIWFIVNILFLGVRFKMFDLGYTSGVKLITSFGNKLSIFTEAASVMGLSVVGALIASVVKITTPLTFQTGQVKLALQTGVLDKIMPALLPALLTLLVYKLLGSKKWTPTRIIILIIAIAMVGAFFGILK